MPLPIMFKLVDRIANIELPSVKIGLASAAVATFLAYYMDGNIISDTTPDLPTSANLDYVSMMLSRTPIIGDGTEFGKSRNTAKQLLLEKIPVLLTKL